MNTDNNDSFATELAKSFAIAAATTAGIYGGMMAAAAVQNKIAARRERKIAKKQN
jgi:hypothetical protein